MVRSNNPVLQDGVFEKIQTYEYSEFATIDGSVNKVGWLLLLVLLPAFYTWNMCMGADTISTIYPLIGGAGIFAFITALVTVFKKSWSPITAPIYAVSEGFLLGGLSAYFEMAYPGIAIQAISLTFFVLLSLLMIYKARLIPVTENFRMGVVAATMGIGLVYLVSFIGGLFGFSMPYIHDSGLIGIGFSAFVVFVASMNLILDFDFIEKCEEYRTPKYMEWYSAFGLMVTLIWLYIEILKLLAKLRDRR